MSNKSNPNPEANTGVPRVSTLRRGIETSNPKPAPPVSHRDLAYVLGRTERLWPEVRGKHIFITGGTGFFGTWLLESLLAANAAFDLRAQATVLTRSARNFRARSPHLAGNRALELLEGDVRDFAFPAGEFPFVIHAATESVTKRSGDEPSDTLSTIVDGTRRCLGFAESHGTRKFLLTSSGAVYGPQPPEITHIAEDTRVAPDPCSPNSAYGEGKRVAELLCGLSAARSGMECKIARAFAFVGPHLPLEAHFAIGNFIRDALAGGPIRVRGDGSARRSYLYAADLAVWLWTILFEAPSMRPYNVGSGQDVSIRELAETVAATLHPGLAIEVAQQATPGAPVQRYVPSVERAERELGITGGIALADAILRTADWSRDRIP
jgi:dTDP-glucose 4,6-dehydratase